MPDERLHDGILRLLRVQPLPTLALAGRLGTPPVTMYTYLYQLRRTGAIVCLPDGCWTLAKGVS